MRLVGKFSVPSLADEQVRASRLQNGENVIPQPEKETFWEKLWDNFQDPLIRILCVALGIILTLALCGFAEWTESAGIATSVLIATFVSTYSEYKNEASFQALQEQAGKIKVTVYRNDTLVSVEFAEVVVGDYVLLSAGDRIPADGLLCAGNVKVNQKSLNGENQLSRKSPAPPDYTCTDVDDFLDPHRCFRGAVAEEGEGVLRVDAVGAKTVHGRLALELGVKDERVAPLQQKLSKLAEMISRLGYMGAVLIALSFIFKQAVLDNHWSLTRMYSYWLNWPVAIHDLVTSLILAIIVIVVAVPEGLPMMIAIVLSMNMRKLLARHVLVRRLLGIETAGAVEVLFADKTGTITEGIFQAEFFLSGEGKRYDNFEQILSLELGKVLSLALRGGSNSVMVNVSGGHVNFVGGNATNRALLRILPNKTLSLDLQYTIQREVLFSSKNKFAAVQLLLPQSALSTLRFPQNIVEQQFFRSQPEAFSISLVQGAAELILDCAVSMCSSEGLLVPLDPDTKRQLRAQIDTLSSTGCRVLGLATSSKALEEMGEIKDEDGPVPPPSELCLLGFIGIADMLRPTSKQAMELARRAGIQVVMVTGDRLETAVAVARSAGMLKADITDKEVERAVITSSDLRKLSAAELSLRLPELKVVARALPSDKSRLVGAMQLEGRVVAMTGDGVNDSAALKRADVSFAMGSGAEVAKEASDIVILDDNFNSIVQAVLYGRTIFKSIRKFVVFQSTINMASMIIVFVGPFMGFDFPLTLIQLLWLNLVMDTLAALAFGGEPALPSYLSDRPISRTAPIIDSAMWSAISCNGVFMAVYALYFLSSDTILRFFSRDVRVPFDQSREARSEIVKQGGSVFLTSFFCFFIFMCAFNAFNVRAHSNQKDASGLCDNITGNPGFMITIPVIFFVQILFTELGGSVLRTVPLTPSEWCILIALASLIVPFDIIRKIIIRRYGDGSSLPRAFASRVKREDISIRVI